MVLNVKKQDLLGKTYSFFLQEFHTLYSKRKSNNKKQNNNRKTEVF